jgi:hypothetical protein
MTDLEVEVEQIRQLYLKFEGLTGLQDADALLLLALVVKNGMGSIESKLEDIYDKLEEIRSEMPDP